MVGWQVDQLGHCFDVEADHGAGVQANPFGSKHQGLHGHTDGSLSFVALQPLPKRDVRIATINSHEWSAASSSGSRRAGGVGQYWYTIE